MTDRTLTLIDDDGTEIVCDILFTYSYEKTKKNYVVFQVRGTQEVSAATYEPTENGEGRLGKVETEEEWAMLEDLLDDYASNLEDAESCGGNCSSCGCSCGEEDCDCGCNE
ncbi:MAG: DUF1292 domain-containing protein [Acholeplasmatales bacterium]|nr:DUF1292 domain-containing protein [Acholeplasmatales bacterium]